MTENTTQMIGAPQAATERASEDQKRLLARIKRAIRRKTSSGVQKLVVELQVEGVRLSGRCTSFYCKQVAQQTAMSYLAEGAQLLNEIEVASLPR